MYDIPCRYGSYISVVLYGRVCIIRVCMPGVVIFPAVCIVLITLFKFTFVVVQASSDGRGVVTRWCSYCKLHGLGIMLLD